MFKFGFRFILAAALLNACSATALAGSLTPPVGPPSSTMRTLDEVDAATVIRSLPFTISSPGVYKLVGDLSSASSGISIEASDVTLDFGGYSLTGAPGAVAGIVVAAMSKNVTIKNGACSGWSQGIRGLSTDGVNLVDLRVSGCTEFGIQMECGTITRCVSEKNGSYGIEVSPTSESSFTMTDSECSGNGLDGLRLSFAPAGSVTVSVSSSRFTGNGTTGTGSGVNASVTNVTCMVTWTSSYLICSDNGSDGMSLDASAFRTITCHDGYSTCQSNARNGFAVSGGGGGGGGGGLLAVSCTGMTCSSNVADGLSFVTVAGASGSSSVHLDSCNFTSNDGGVTIEDTWTRGSVRMTNIGMSGNTCRGCSITVADLDCDGCTFSNNGVVGSSFSGGGFICGQTGHFRNCSFVGNTGAGCVVSAATFIGKGMRCSGNGSHGIELTSDDTDCDDFTCVSNGGSGIKHKGHTSVALTATGTFSDGRCSSNNLDGIDLDGVPFKFVVTGTYSDGNTACGVRVRGWDSTTKGSIVADACSFSSNGECGMQVDACNSSIVCSSVRCDNNGSSGFLRKGWDGTIKGNTSFQDCDFSFNAAAGCSIEGGYLDMDSDCDSFSNNGGDGLEVGKGAASVLRGTVTIVKSCFNSNLTGGLDLACLSGAIVSHCQADKNTGSGIVLEGNALRVSNNRACDNSVSGIRLGIGTHGEVCDNACISNPTGIFIADTGNSVSRNTSSNCPTPINSPPGTDLAPSSSAAAATSPFSNIQF